MCTLVHNNQDSVSVTLHEFNVLLGRGRHFQSTTGQLAEHGISALRISIESRQVYPMQVCISNKHVIFPIPHFQCWSSPYCHGLHFLSAALKQGDTGNSIFETIV